MDIQIIKNMHLRLHRNGFTLIELIIVILLISVISVSIIPRFFDKQGVDEHLFLQQLVGLLRLQQTKAMQNTTETCHRVLFTSSRFGVTFDNTNNEDCTSTALPTEYSAIAADFDVSHYGISASEVVSSSVSFSITSSFNNRIYFNLLGCPVTSEGAQCGVTDVLVTISGSETLYVCIESQGYIHKGACT
ncbi:prepilin-type N-terminal cleavage/methylation domain-containing protein [Algibacillus agarilyticus]|uniref:prepilin-type N-terminal cleavage/methylation domain-containing protein n=1 Tax=Algibacillus agarilyticus TaxID=2234133 RepID=UPI0013002714|nr:prepilin-type N-terminal cleavage/methylation domain-containing protein [Algibacillus agarilyticus]